MNYPLLGNFPITQKFGERPEYYKEYGLKGHEGVDFGCPVGSVVIAVADGKVVRRDFSAKNYGNYCVIWHPQLKLASWYCHLDTVLVNIGDEVGALKQIATSGNSGKTSGQHLHFNICEVDDNGYRINKDNGYQGFVDPLPYLQKPQGGDSMDPEILKRADAFVAVSDLLGKPVDKDVVLAEVKQLITYEDQVVQTNKALSEKEAQLKVLSDHVGDLAEQNNELQDDLEEIQKKVDDQKQELVVATEQIKQLKTIRPISEYSRIELLIRAIIGR